MHSEIRAKIRLLLTEEGRHNSIHTNYHGALWINPDPKSGGNDGIFTLEGQDVLLPGEECIARIRLIAPELVQDFLKVSESFDIREGRRLVGRGTIIEVL